MKETIQILKADGRGRVQTPRERREALVEGFAQSGMTGMAYAKLCGVNYSTFAGWLQRRRRERLAGFAKPVQAEVKVTQAPVVATAPLTVHLPGGARVEITDWTTLSPTASRSKTRRAVATSSIKKKTIA